MDNIDPRIKAFNEACEKVLNAAVALEEAKSELHFRYSLIPLEQRRDFIQQFVDAERLGEKN